MALMFLTNLMRSSRCAWSGRFLLHPYGLVNQMLSPFGVEPRRLADDGWMAMPAIIVVTVWRFAPTSWWCSAALLGCQGTIYEAAKLDGATPSTASGNHAALLAAHHFFVVRDLGGACCAARHLPDAVSSSPEAGAQRHARALDADLREPGSNMRWDRRGGRSRFVLFALMLYSPCWQHDILLRPGLE